MQTRNSNGARKLNKCQLCWSTFLSGADLLATTFTRSNSMRYKCVIGYGILATNELDLTTPNVIFLRFTDGNNPALNIDNLITAKILSQNLKNILARVQLNQPPNAIVFNNSGFRSTTNYLQIPDTYGTRVLTTMHFEWIDEYNNPIDFNGVDHTMLLRVFVTSVQTYFL